jgi:hypothetical protein
MGAFDGDFKYPSSSQQYVMIYGLIQSKSYQLTIFVVAAPSLLRYIDSRQRRWY